MHQFFYQTVQRLEWKMGYSKTPDKEEYCPKCGSVQSVTQTVAWQPNQCSECGTEITA